jgi:hypothetical protein
MHEHGIQSKNWVISRCQCQYHSRSATKPRSMRPFCDAHRCGGKVLRWRKFSLLDYWKSPGSNQCLHLLLTRLPMNPWTCLATISILWTTTFIALLQLNDFDTDQMLLGIQSKRSLRHESFANSTETIHRPQVCSGKNCHSVPWSGCNVITYPKHPLVLKKAPDFGGLIGVAKGVTARNVAHDDDHNFAKFRESLLETMDVDLDRSYYNAEDVQDDPARDCRDVPWKDHKFPNCNEVHQVVLERHYRCNAESLQDYNVTYLR